MGRWGYTMFRGDIDQDILDEYEAATDVNLDDPPEKLEAARKKLDEGLGAELFEKTKKSDGWECVTDSGYTSCVLAAFMMQVGAKITPEHREHIEKKLPGISSKAGYVWPLSDSGFRTPGKAQFTAALENYVDGKPRSFFEPSCYGCGKINIDIAPEHLKKCQGCVKHEKEGYYCNRDCQKKDWKLHKPICIPPRGSPGGFIMMNV